MNKVNSSKTDHPFVGVPGLGTNHSKVGLNLIGTTDGETHFPHVDVFKYAVTEDFGGMGMGSEGFKPLLAGLSDGGVTDFTISEDGVVRLTSEESLVPSDQRVESIAIKQKIKIALTSKTMVFVNIEPYFVESDPTSINKDVVAQLRLGSAGLQGTGKILNACKAESGNLLEQANGTLMDMADRAVEHADHEMRLVKMFLHYYSCIIAMSMGKSKVLRVQPPNHASLTLLSRLNIAANDQSPIYSETATDGTYNTFLAASVGPSPMFNFGRMVVPPISSTIVLPGERTAIVVSDGGDPSVVNVDRRTLATPEYVLAMTVAYADSVGARRQLGIARDKAIGLICKRRLCKKRMDVEINMPSPLIDLFPTLLSHSIPLTDVKLPSIGSLADLIGASISTELLLLALYDNFEVMASPGLYGAARLLADTVKFLKNSRHSLRLAVRDLGSRCSNVPIAPFMAVDLFTGVDSGQLSKHLQTVVSRGALLSQVNTKVGSSLSAVKHFQVADNYGSHGAVDKALRHTRAAETFFFERQGIVRVNNQRHPGEVKKRMIFEQLLGAEVRFVFRGLVQIPDAKRSLNGFDAGSFTWIEPEEEFIPGEVEWEVYEDSDEELDQLSEHDDEGEESEGSVIDGGWSSGDEELAATWAEDTAQTEAVRTESVQAMLGQLDKRGDTLFGRPRPGRDTLNEVENSRVIREGLSGWTESEEKFVTPISKEVADDLNKKIQKSEDATKNLKAAVNAVQNKMTSSERPADEKLRLAEQLKHLKREAKRLEAGMRKQVAITAKTIKRATVVKESKEVVDAIEKEAEVRRKMEEAAKMAVAEKETEEDWEPKPGFERPKNLRLNSSMAVKILTEPTEVKKFICHHHEAWDKSKNLLKDSSVPLNSIKAVRKVVNGTDWCLKCKDLKHIVMTAWLDLIEANRCCANYNWVWLSTEGKATRVTNIVQDSVEVARAILLETFPRVTSFRPLCNKCELIHKLTKGMTDSHMKTLLHAIDMKKLGRNRSK